MMCSILAKSVHGFSFISFHKTETSFHALSSMSCFVVSIQCTRVAVYLF